MTQQEINENNKLIAEFMGGKIKSNNSKIYPDLFEFPIDLPNGCSEWPTTALIYHKSWDWLMLVVEVIWGYIGNRESIFYFENNECSIIPITDGFDSKQDCYEAVIEFIKWYNKNK